MNIFRKCVRRVTKYPPVKKSIIACKRLYSRARKVLTLAAAMPARYWTAYTSKVKNNKIIFMTFSHTYSCNPKYICEEILRQELPVEMVWCVKTAQLKSPAARATFPENMKMVVRGTKPFFKEIATSKVWIDNAFGFTWNPMPKKKNQFYIQNWHGSFGLKRMGKEDVKSRRWAFSASLNARYADVCISNSTFETDLYRKTHWPKNKILELGHARNDILFADDETKAQIKKKVFEYFGIPKGAKVALYAPTFRNKDQSDIYDLDHSRFLDALEKRFGGDWVLLNRYHFKVKRAKKQFGKVMATDERLLSATAYPDIQELMVAADVGITDYSSWICDFMLTDRPSFLYTPDLSDYDQERGFYYPLSDTPFPIAETNDEMEANVLSFDQEVFSKKNKEFLEARGCKEQGTAAKEIVEIIKQQCGLS